jgi:hypothetical protein
MGAVLTNRYTDMPICRYAGIFQRRIRENGRGVGQSMRDMPICRCGVLPGRRRNGVLTNRYADMPVSAGCSEA